MDLTVGSLALHCAKENPDGVVAALDDKAEAVTNAVSNQLEVCSYGRSMSDMGRVPVLSCRGRMTAEELKGAGEHPDGRYPAHTTGHQPPQRSVPAMCR